MSEIYRPNAFVISFCIFFADGPTCEIPQWTLTYAGSKYGVLRKDVAVGV